MTETDFMKKCRRIMASGSYTVRGKAEAIEKEAESLVDSIMENLPEVHAIRKREDALETKHSQPGSNPFCCPECSTWHPKEPPEIAEFDCMWDRIKAAKKAEFIKKALKGKAA